MVKNINKIKKHLIIKQVNPKLLKSLVSFFEKDIIKTSRRRRWSTGRNTYELDSYYCVHGKGCPVLLDVYYNRDNGSYVLIDKNRTDELVEY